MGDDKDIVTVTFTVKSELVAEDLVHGLKEAMILSRCKC